MSFVHMWNQVLQVCLQSCHRGWFVLWCSWAACGSNRVPNTVPRGVWKETTAPCSDWRARRRHRAHTQETARAKQRGGEAQISQTARLRAGEAARLREPSGRGRETQAITDGTSKGQKRQGETRASQEETGEGLNRGGWRGGAPWFVITRNEK